MAAAWTCPARILRCHGDKVAAIPCELIVQLALKLKPALIEDGSVQAGLGPNVSSRFPGTTRRRPGHIAHLQVLDTHHRVVLADRGLVQVVAERVTDAGVKTLDSGLGLLPIVAELYLAAHGLLRFAQSVPVPLETVEWRVERTIRERGEAGHTHVDAERATIRHRLLDLTLGLDGHMPLTAGLTDGDILERAERIPAVTESQPAQFGQKQAAIRLIAPGLLRVWKAEAVGLALLLELGKSARKAKKLVEARSRSLSACCIGWTGASASHAEPTPLRQPVSSLHSPA